MTEPDPQLRRNAEATSRLAALVVRIGAADLERSLGGGWTVAFALAHLAFWDVRQAIALGRYARDGAFPPEDATTNATLEAIAPLFHGDGLGPMAVRAAERADAALRALTPTQRAALLEAGLDFAVERWRHRDEHIAHLTEEHAALNRAMAELQEQLHAVEQQDVACRRDDGGGRGGLGGCCGAHGVSGG